MTATRLHLFFGALLGAAGVILMALSAHANAALMLTAGNIFLFHAPAIMAGTVARKLGFLHARMAQAALAFLILGVSLFGGDLVMRETSGQRLFPYAAPTGGSLMIAGWVLIALSAVFPGSVNISRHSPQN